MIESSWRIRDVFGVATTREKAVPFSNITSTSTREMSRALSAANPTSVIMPIGATENGPASRNPFSRSKLVTCPPCLSPKSCNCV